MKSNPTWFPPRHGDIAIIERCVEGGDPYTIAVVWIHSEQAWRNVSGPGGPMPAQPQPHEFRALVVRDDTPVPVAPWLTVPLRERVAK